MQLLNIIDPRDNLEKAKRRELLDFAHAHGLNHLTSEMPAILIRKQLRAHGLTNIKVPSRPLGKVETSGSLTADQAVSDENIVSIDAADDLARQYGLEPIEEKPIEEPKAKPMPKNTNIITEHANLKKECKARGIKIARTDTREMLKAKLGGKISS